MRWPQTVRSESKIEEVSILVHTNRSQSVHDLASVVGVSYSTCYKIIADNLNMSHSVPGILTQGQRDDRMTIRGNLISSADDDPMFPNRLITGIVDPGWI